LKLKWVDPGTSRVVVTNSKYRKTWPARQLTNNDLKLEYFSMLLPGSDRVSFAPTASGMLFFAAKSGDDEACVTTAGAVPNRDFREVLGYDIRIGGKLAVFPGGIAGAALRPVIATTPKHGLHRVYISGPVQGDGAELAFVVRLEPWAGPLQGAASR
jgi:hypothetical protein